MLGDDIADVGKDTIAIDLVFLDKIVSGLMFNFFFKVCGMEKS
jgi:hypothetical protein